MIEFHRRDDVNGQSVGLSKGISSVRDSLRALDKSLRRLAPLLSTAVMNGKELNSQEARRPRPRLSPKARASMVLQGRYMGYMRQLNPRQKGQVRKTRKVHGVKAAISRARQLASL